MALGIAWSWILAGMTGFLPVFTGIYNLGVNTEHANVTDSIPQEPSEWTNVGEKLECDLVVNKVQWLSNKILLSQSLN